MTDKVRMVCTVHTQSGATPAASTRAEVVDATEDRRKQRIWEAAAWTVRRLPTDDVYAFPERLIALAPAR